MKTPLSVQLDLFGPDSVRLLWADEVLKCVVRAGLAFPSESSVDGQGFALLVVRPLDPSKPAFVELQEPWSVVDPVYDEERKMLVDPGLVSWIAKARSRWGCTRLVHAELEQAVALQRRQIRANRMVAEDVSISRAEFGDDAAGWSLIFDWTFAQKLAFAPDSAVAELVAQAQSTPKMPLLAPAAALASALWSLSRRGTRAEEVSRLSEIHPALRGSAVNEI